MSNRLRVIIPLLLLFAALACNAPFQSNRPDSQATVGAVYATITAHAQAATTPSADDDGDGGPGITPNMPTQPPGESSGGSSSETPEAEVSPTVSPTAPAERTDNGPNVTLARCSKPITVDVDTSDWDAQTGNITELSMGTNTYGAANWGGLNDASGEARLCWTEEALFMLIEVTDDVHVQTQTGGTQWRGDEIEMMFDSDLRGDFYAALWNDDDTQLGLSPGDFGDIPPSDYRFHPTDGNPSGVEVAARRLLETGGSYLLEVRVAWSALNMVPAAGANYGFCLAISDNDQVGQASQDSMVSNCEDLLVSNPTTYVTLTLAP